MQCLHQKAAPDCRPDADDHCDQVEANRELAEIPKRSDIWLRRVVNHPPLDAISPCRTTAANRAIEHNRIVLIDGSTQSYHGSPICEEVREVSLAPTVVAVRLSNLSQPHRSPITILPGPGLSSAATRSGFRARILLALRFLQDEGRRTE